MGVGDWRRVWVMIGVFRFVALTVLFFYYFMVAWGVWVNFSRVAGRHDVYEVQ